MRTALNGFCGLVGTLALCGSVTVCRADTGWAGSLAATTDYVFRGLSQTQNAGALQGDLHYQALSGWYVGAWGSNVKLDDSGYDPARPDYGSPQRQRAPYGYSETDYDPAQPTRSPKQEINLYAGLAGAVTADWSARITAVHYFYPQGHSDYDYDELAAGVDYQNRLFLTVAWSPDMTRYSFLGSARRRTALSYEINVRQPVWRGFSVGAGGGYYDLTHLFERSYWAGNAGVLYGTGPWQVDLMYYKVSGDARRLFGDEVAKDHWVATVLWRF